MLRSGGVEWWGSNSSGQLGDGTTTDSTAPVHVSGLTSGVVAITAGAFHSCAMLTGGSAKCWGQNGYGQLGTGAAGGLAKTPVDLTGLAGGVTLLAAGGWHTCAVTTSGGAKCWGSNVLGQLGNGLAWRATPGYVIGFGAVLPYGSYLPTVLH